MRSRRAPRSVRDSSSSRGLQLRGRGRRCRRLAASTTSSIAAWVRWLGRSEDLGRGFRWCSDRPSRSLAWGPICICSSRRLELGPIAAGFAVFFGMVNCFGAKKSSSFQVFPLIGVLILLAWFCGLGALQADFAGFYDSGSTGIISTAGLVIVSDMGMTSVASVAEEVQDPERNLPHGSRRCANGTASRLGLMGRESYRCG